jgi:multidrug resistance efflux pump
VRTIAVAEGDEVEAGQVLVMLDTSILETDVRKAEAALAEAQAHLARVKASPRPEEVAAAKARLEAAKAQVAQAAAQGDQPDLGATEAEVTAAQADIAAATADRLAADELHGKTMKCVKVDMPGGETKKICPALGPIEEQARYNLQAAEEARVAAQAELDALLAGGDAEVRAARAGVWAAAAGQDLAQAQLDTLQAGAIAEEVTAAKARVAQAEATLQAALAALDQATLRAPFAGTVTLLEISVGETASPGQAVLKLADLSHLQVETTDLSELDVGRVAKGQPVTVFVEPLGVEVAGRVAHIASQAEEIGGDVMYAVVVELDEQPPGLRWRMSAEVEIETEQED